MFGSLVVLRAMATKDVREPLQSRVQLGAHPVGKTRPPSDSLLAERCSMVTESDKHMSQFLQEKRTFHDGFTFQSETRPKAVLARSKCDPSGDHRRATTSAEGVASWLCGLNEVSLCPVGHS